MEISKDACRVCLRGPRSVSPKENWESISIFDRDIKDNVPYSQKFSACTRIPLSTKLARRICKRCIQHIRIAYSFHMISMRSEKILQQYLNGNLKKNETTSSNKCISNDSWQKVEIKKENKTPLKWPTISSTTIKSNSPPLDEIKNEKDNNYNDDDNNNDNTFDHDTDGSSDYGLQSDSEQFFSNTNNIQSQRRNDVMHEDPYLICDICGNLYKRTNFLSHMRMHSDKKDYKCEICGKEFLLSSYLSSHMRTHTGVKNFSCDYCSRKFFTNGKKKAHEKIHLNESQYKCDICDRTFNYSQSLKKHLFCHTDLKPHQCPECGKQFRTTSNLKQHLRTGLHKTNSAPNKLIESSTIQTYNEDECEIATNIIKFEKL